MQCIEIETFHRETMRMVQYTKRVQMTKPHICTFIFIHIRTEIYNSQFSRYPDQPEGGGGEAKIQIYGLLSFVQIKRQNGFNGN